MLVLRTLRSVVVALALLVLVGVPDTLVALDTGSVEGTVAIKRGRRYKKDRSGIVVVIEGVPDSEPEPTMMPAVVDQTDKTFNPGLTVVPVGSTVDFPNNDRVFHNVFSVSRPARFDLGLYQSGSSKSVVFERPGVVDVYCNIHPQMAAKIYVVDTKHYAVTGPDGTFSLHGIPPGTYTMRAWQAQGEAYEGQVRVRSGGSTAVELELTEDRWPSTRHTRKDGTPYGRYK